MSESLELQNVLHSLPDYLQLTDPTTMQAFTVGQVLQAWFDERGDSNTHVVHVDAGATGVSLMVGDICVWDSEADDTEQLTAEYCLTDYQRQLTALLAPFQQVAVADEMDTDS